MNFNDWVSHGIREDYSLFLSEHGLTDAQVKAAAEDHSDSIPQPPEETANYTVQHSYINGAGAFAARAFLRGQLIGTLNFSGKRTPLGRLVNHSPFANSIMISEEPWNIIFLVAVSAIAEGEEITCNYRLAPAARELRRLRTEDQ